jgi:S1-C subfamily serine protease
MKRTAPILLVSVMLLGAALACRLTPSSLTLSSTSTPALPTAVQAPGSQSVPNLVDEQDALVSLYKQVSPGVVSLQVVTNDGSGQGSGFVYDKEGHIITNLHVVEDTTDLEVDFPSGMKVHGKVVGIDQDSDIAVVKVEASPDALYPLPLGSGEALKVGQTVVAIGNPFGLAGTMTTGIVSAKGRTLESLREAPQGGYFSAGAVIQTDAAINPGNSGGPLLNLDGQVVGINRAIIANSTTGESTNSGVGFAVNIDIVKRVVPELIENGKYDYPYLGITSQEEITLLMAEALDLPQAIGAYVLEVRSGSPADKAGVLAGNQPTSLSGVYGGGDLIIGVDGREVRVFGDLLTYLMTSKSPGDSIVLTVLRDGQQKEVTVTLGKRP